MTRISQMTRISHLKKLMLGLLVTALVALVSSATATNLGVNFTSHSGSMLLNGGPSVEVCEITTNNFGQSGSLGTITTTLQGNGQIRVDVALNPNYVIHANDALGFNAAGGFSGVAIVGPPAFTMLQ